jgi:hypothetical protein
MMARRVRISGQFHSQKVMAPVARTRVLQLSSTASPGGDAGLYPVLSCQAGMSAMPWRIAIVELLMQSTENGPPNMRSTPDDGASATAINQQHVTPVAVAQTGSRSYGPDVS